MYFLILWYILLIFQSNCMMKLYVNKLIQNQKYMFETLNNEEKKLDRLNYSSSMKDK